MKTLHLNGTNRAIAVFMVLALITGCGTDDTKSTEGKKMGNEIVLPPPDIKKSTFLQTIQKRHTTRDYATKQLPITEVSNILYAAYGINRPKTGKRTAPSAHDWQYVDIYVSDANGLYIFNPQKPSLEIILEKDVRKKTGIQEYPASAPLNFVYVVNYARMPQDLPEKEKSLFGITTVGAIVQNVYLYAASAELVSGVRADIRREPLRKTMKLNDDQEIILAQSVGYPSVVGEVKKWVHNIF
ncbi:MAG: nitroreductase family protein [Deltaproteobacteria bacterium]|nr:nitroreductase family protein [Deltaproteobacteria bacterium]